jgi:hypothetical protein
MSRIFKELEYTYLKSCYNCANFTHGSEGWYGKCDLNNKVVAHEEITGCDDNFKKQDISFEMDSKIDGVLNLCRDSEDFQYILDYLEKNKIAESRLKNCEHKVK